MVDLVQILLVEDDIDSAYLTEAATQRANAPFRISVVSDGIEAIDFLMKRPPFESVQRPDIIFLDLNLPRKNGEELLADLKKDADLKKIPVVILTTSNQHHNLKTMYALPDDCYQVKPSGFQEYIDLMKKLADSYKHGRLIPIEK